jgi:hypothetical protein
MLSHHCIKIAFSLSTYPSRVSAGDLGSSVQDLKFVVFTYPFFGQILKSSGTFLFPQEVESDHPDYLPEKDYPSVEL